MYEETYAKKVKILIARRGSQQKLAKELGTSQTQISRWANGECEPGYKYQLKINEKYVKK